MDLIKERLNQIDLKLRQLGGKMTLLKRQNAQLLAENVRLKKQLEQNKSNNFAWQSKESGEEESKRVHVESDKERMELKKKIEEYISQIDTCIEDLEKL